VYGLIGSVDMARSGAWYKELTPREREVARLVARGLSNKQVARNLGLSDGTVKQHLHKIFQKLGANNRRALRGHFQRAAE
jgi:RNA polymerase sigma factor (sigma-70 family)